MRATLCLYFLAASVHVTTGLRTTAHDLLGSCQDPNGTDFRYCGLSLCPNREQTAESHDALEGGEDAAGDGALASLNIIRGPRPTKFPVDHTKYDDKRRQTGDVTFNRCHLTLKGRSTQVLRAAYYGDEISPIRSQGGGAQMRQVLDKLKAEGGNVLSFGAADGTEALVWKEWFPKAKVWGYEIDEAFVQSNRERILNLGLTQYTASREQVPLNHFHVVTCNYVFYFDMTEPQFKKAMKFFLAVLRPGGVLELLVHNSVVYTWLYLYLAERKDAQYSLGRLNRNNYTQIMLLHAKPNVATPAVPPYRA